MTSNGLNNEHSNDGGSSGKSWCSSRLAAWRQEREQLQYRWLGAAQVSSNLGVGRQAWLGKQQRWGSGDQSVDVTKRLLLGHSRGLVRQRVGLQGGPLLARLLVKPARESTKPQVV
ncbi:hypothetical protein NL676_018101 [Syzygium grande]|nr:hypothetical protein NL676_018101 [Syzygium grande]